MQSKTTVLMVSLSLFILLFGGCSGQKDTGFSVIETSISEIHGALRRGEITCQQLVRMYLKRIETFDQATTLNAIVVTHPNALKRAKALDAEFQKTGKLRLLHGIPIIVKDNYDTKDLQTAAGSIALEGSIPPDDASQVSKLREAGAVILAKSNMAEWAFSPYQTVSSIAGTTRNPYDLSRVPAGSSGGTAAAVSANLGAVGLGTDTGNSIRGPSSHNGLVGIRSTMGLTSRDGIIPLYLRNDIGGPMARSVEDAVRILEIIAGYDPADPITARCVGKIPDNYVQFLDRDGLRGARIGIFRTYIESETIDEQVKGLMEKAIESMSELGAVIIDPFEIPDYETLTEDLWCNTFRHDVNAYLATLDENAPVRSLEEVYRRGLYAPYVKTRIERALREKTPPEERDPPCTDLYNTPKNVALRKAVLAAMDEFQLDAIAFPTWSNPPRKVGDLKSPAGDNSQILSPHTGFPALTVPMGMTYGSLPAGLQFVGRPFGEPALIRIAYGYEQATRHRRPPAGFDVDIR